MPVKTQIGGKYHRDDPTIFTLKWHLQSAQVIVTHPLADAIIASDQEHGYAFDPKVHSFYDVELDYYCSMATSNFHTVCNRFGGNLGYIGGSASLEIMYAMLHSRPIVLLYPPTLRVEADSFTKEFLRQRLALVQVINLLQLDVESLVAFVNSIRESSTNYSVDQDAAHEIRERVRKLFGALHEESPREGALMLPPLTLCPSKIHKQKGSFYRGDHSCYFLLYRCQYGSQFS